MLPQFKLIFKLEEVKIKILKDFKLKNLLLSFRPKYFNNSFKKLLNSWITNNFFEFMALIFVKGKHVEIMIKKII